MSLSIQAKSIITEMQAVAAIQVDKEIHPDVERMTSDAVQADLDNFTFTDATQADLVALQGVAYDLGYELTEVNTALIRFNI